MSLYARDMNVFGLEECKGDDITDPSSGGQKDIIVQVVISLALGLSSFVGFCLLRPKWKSLYAARKRQKDAAGSLPELPDTFFGWIPVLYKVTEQQVLASAGLDAFVFLAFFKMAIKFLGIAFLLAAIIIAPINAHFANLPSPFGDVKKHKNDTSEEMYEYQTWLFHGEVDIWAKPKQSKDTSYLWAYLVFTYTFTALAIYFLISETKRIIQIRQDYLGSQSTITDRTIRLSGIPEDLRTEDKIKEILEKLEIGEVESVTICRDWRELDNLMDERAYTLRKLEESLTVHLGQHEIQRNLESLPIVQPLPPTHTVQDEDDEEEQPETDNLLGGSNHHAGSAEKPRPTIRLRYGFLKLKSKKVDAIDYYEEHLRQLDEKIQEARKQEYKATPMAFVTMDSIPACQMAVQALLDPAPNQLQASLAPAPSDIVWPNTYLPRSSRMVRSWIITVFIFILTIIWLIPIGSLASLLNLCSIEKIWPALAQLLSRHEIVKALVQTGLPTLVVSILNVAVPYLYDFLANLQGSISQSDVELSVISKNFFFTFFNIFLVFTAFGTASKILPTLQDSLRDSTRIAYNLASSVQSLGLFYTNFILLQGVGLFPLRLLEFGSVSLYPIMRMGAKTPRDFAELVQPPIFKYGFYLPSAILIFILCLVYSVLPVGYMVLFFGFLYFAIGHFTFKYQLLYAMDHPQHATGGAWTIIAYRIMIGLGIFQVTMAGVIALKSNFTPAILVLPLVGFTIWFSYYYARTYEPLTKYIALRSIRREDNSDINIADEDIGINRPPGHLRRGSTTIDEGREKGQLFVNPSLIVPLQKVWINGEVDDDPQPPTLLTADSVASAESLGDTHIWRENGDRNV